MLPMRFWRLGLLIAVLVCGGGQQLLVAEDEGGGGLFDLFGRKIEPETAAVEGEMPAGPLEIVMDRNAPRFGSKRRSSSSSGRTTRAKPLWTKKIQWSRSQDAQVNSGGSGSASAATHLVKSGGRVYLRSY